MAVDGCGAPAFVISLHGLTRAIARIAVAPLQTPEGQVANAIRKHPDMLGGTRRDVSLLIKAVPGLVAKDGFEAVQVAALPDGRAVGVKIADGFGPGPDAGHGRGAGPVRRRRRGARALRRHSRHEAANRSWEACGSRANSPTAWRPVRPGPHNRRAHAIRCSTTGRAVNDKPATASSTICSATATSPQMPITGVHTLRAVENFPITGTPISTYPTWSMALAYVKQAAAQANHDLGLLEQEQGRRDRRGLQGDPVAGCCTTSSWSTSIQGGAGTSTNMNANEVIANRALELLGHAQGRLRPAAPAGGRQPQPVHQRRLPDRRQRRHGTSPSAGCWRR